MNDLAFACCGLVGMKPSRGRISSVAVPAGWDSDGVPQSVQLVGRRGAEDVLYALAGQLERTAPWADRRPPGF